MTNLYFQCLSFFYLFMIFVLFFGRKKVKSFTNKMYAMLLITNVVMIVLDIIIVYLSYIVPNHGILYLLNKIYLISIVYWMFIYSYYFTCIGSKSKKRDKKKNVRLLIILLIVTTLTLLCPISLYNEDNVMYTHGLSVTVVIASGVIIMLYTFYTLFKNMHNIIKSNKKQYLPLVVLVLLSLLMLTVRLIDPSILLTTAFITFITIFMYHTIENPDVKTIEMLKLANGQVEKSNRAKTDFLSSMSHEIRTPLNAVIGFSECIKEEDDIEIVHEDANDIIIASETLLEIVNGILDISKIEANKMEVVNVEYDLIPNMINIVKLIEPRIGDKDIEFNYSFAPDIPSVMYGDIAKIKQIVTNLLTNAAKYTTKGRIDFNISCINTKGISSLVISVKDTGRGIKEEHIKNLFTKFSRLDEDKNTTIEGTGLGLTITKSLIKLLGGKIVVKSKYTEGSEFIVCVKQKIVSSKPRKLEDLATNSAALKFDNYKVLLVDDNSLNLKVATRLLKKYGITPVCLTSGGECLELVKKEHFDLILLDDMMPKLSGKETLIKLKENKEFSSPVVALTANAISGMKKHYMDIGFDNYLAKPIDVVSLVEVLKKYYKEDCKIDENTKVIENKEDISGVKKVLIVDDNTINIKITERFLKKLDVEIKSVTSGADCISLLQKEKIDLILMDDMMPEMSGVKTLETLKENKKFNIPVIALTANAVEGARAHYLSKGFIDYISKPIDVDIFLKTVKGILGLDIKDEEVKIKNNHTKEYLISKGVDIDYSLSLLGDMVMYDETLKDFMDNITTRRKSLDKYKDSDMKNYAIEVHALKSDCKYLGFMKLADIAYEHELKSKADDSKYVGDNYDKLLEEYKKLIKNLKEYIG